MTVKQNLGSQAPDGSTYVVLTDGAGNLGGSITASSTENLTQIAGTAVDVNSGNKSAGTLRVVLATDQPQLTNTLLVKQSRSATGAKTNVASSATSVTILASNANRLGMAVYNDSTQILYLDLTGGTASSSSYSLQIAPSAWYILDAPWYTGAITGIWASANGNARVTEWT